jgi:enoyl-CoA hydratase/carnithine racemase
MIAPCLSAISHCAVPTVAAIDGPCIGGGLEVASVCDIRIASDRSTFGLPIHRLGFSIAPAEAAALLALVPKSVVLELLLEGRILEAEEAFEKGIVSRVVAAELWRDEVAVTVSRICSGAPTAVRRTKWLIRELSASLSASQADHALSPVAREGCWDFVESQDYQRGVAAFLEKSTPSFTGD